MNADRQNSIIFNLALISILCLSAFLRIYHLDFQSLWIDEVNTMVQARPDQSFMDTYRGLSMDLQPPLYFYILKYFFCLFGYSTFVLRLFSAILGVAGVFAIYLLGKELAGKKAGLYAAFILCLNFFHIYYSQEARPYTFLILFTILSFHALIRFIKKPVLKTAFIWGALAALMLYGHPTGLFTLFVQFVILLICLSEAGEKRRNLLKLSVTGGLTTAILFLPAVPIFMRAAGIKSFWIPMPGADVYGQMLAEFFGRSEMVLSLVYILILWFLVKVFSTDRSFNFTTGLSDKQPAAIFIFLTAWLSIGLLLPLIRSYLNVPMILPRYMIGLLPTFILVAAVSVSYITHRMVRLSILLLLTAFSLTDLLVVKNYYNTITKSQIREVTQYIKDNKINEEPVITDLWWHYRYFLSPANCQIPEIDPGAFINRMISGEETLKPFWYSSAHNFKYDHLPEAQKQFLTERFLITQKLNLHDAWAVHFVPKNGNTSIQLNMAAFQPLNAGGGAYIFLYNNDVSTLSEPVFLSRGNYTFYLEGLSEPVKPINHINSHITVTMNDRRIGGLFLPDGSSPKICHFGFSVSQDGPAKFELHFDNDLMLNNKDRNALIYSIRLEKIVSPNQN